MRQLHLSYVCMFDASQALMRAGVTGRHAVTLFAIRACSAGAGIALRMAGFSQDDGAALIVAVSDRAYDDALSWGIPPARRQKFH